MESIFRRERKCFQVLCMLSERQVAEFMFAGVQHL